MQTIIHRSIILLVFSASFQDTAKLSLVLKILPASEAQLKKANKDIINYQ